MINCKINLKKVGGKNKKIDKIIIVLKVDKGCNYALDVKRSIVVLHRKIRVLYGWRMGDCVKIHTAVEPALVQALQPFINSMRPLEAAVPSGGVGKEYICQ